MRRETEQPAVESHPDRPPAREETQTAPPRVSAGVARGLTPAHVMALQRGSGNQAAGRAIAMAGRAPATAARAPAAPATTPGPALAPANAVAPAGQAQQGAGAADPALEFIADYARKVPGYTLVAHAVGADPITGGPVPGSLVREVVGMIPGGAALMERLDQSGVLPKASAWLSEEIGKLGLSFAQIAGLFERAWDSISAWDLIDPAGAWARLSSIFEPAIAKVVAFAERAAEKLFEFSLEAMLAAGGGAATQVMGVLKRAGAAFGAIVRDPLGFAANLVAAVKGGFQAFASNIGAHLQRGLLEWLTGALQGAIRLPAKLDFEGVISLVTQLLGLTWDRLRSKLVKLVGEKTVARIEKTVSFVKDIADRGLGAVWEKLLEFAGGLADTVIGGIRDWIAESVVGAAIKRIATMFNPAGAIINAVLAVYNTIEFVIERARQLGELIDAVSTSISEIASGAIGRAVNAVENALGRAVPVAIGFLAQLLGLDGLGEKIKDIIEKVRGNVDGAIDKVIAWIVDKGRALMGNDKPQGAAAPAGEDGADQPDPHGEAAVAPVTLKMAEEDHEFIAVAGSPLLMASEVPAPLAPRLAAEKERVEEQRKTATGEEADKLDRQKLALAAITRQVVQIDAAILERGPEDPVIAHGLTLLRALTEDYGVDYGRRSFGGVWGETSAGDAGKYGRLRSSAGMIREHIVPSALFAAMGEVKRDDKAFRPVDRGMTTIAWDSTAAALKTYGRVLVGDTEVKLADHIGDNEATERAKATMASGSNFSMNEFGYDRIGAAQEAARLLELETPTAEQIAGAGGRQLSEIHELMAAMQR